MYLSRGQRIKLSDLTNSPNFNIKVSAEDFKHTSYDISCFGLDENDQCSDDKYMIFYNQKFSPCNSIKLLDSQQNNLENFEINISRIPSKIKKLVFTITIDGPAVMSDLKEGSLLLFENNNLKGGFKFYGSDFKNEKSIMVCEIYIKNEWRFSAIGAGFNGGLSALLKHFGIDEETNDINHSPLPNNANNNPQPPLGDNSRFNGFNNQNLNTSINQNINKFSNFMRGVFDNSIKFIENKKETIEVNLVKNANLKKFQNLLRDYLSDGVLTKEEMRNLDVFCLQNNLNLQDCLIASKNDVETFLRVMLANIVSDGIVTSEEEEAINSVCHFLNPSFSLRREIEDTIIRVKNLQNIKSGNIPVLTKHTLITTNSELVWHNQPNVQLIRELKNETKAHNGEIFVTSERIIFKAYDFPVEILLRNIVDMEVDGLHFYIVGKSSRSTSRFKLNEGEILGAYIEQALNKFHRRLDLSQTANKTRSIPRDVKQSVWLRDRGQCMECRATEYLEFDHIIPFSKGGSNSVNNIQLLCRRCNLTKSDRI